MAKKKADPTKPAMIGEQVLRRLLKSEKTYKQQVADLNGEAREQIKNAIEKNHLHKGAFVILKKLDKMDDTDLAFLWDTLLAYMDMSGVMKRIESVPELPMGQPVEEEDQQDHRLPQAAE